MGPRPEDLNEALVASLENSGTLSDRRVANAFRAVLRHRFLPDHPLKDVYEDTAIMTKFGEHGVAVSSSSQPAIMAIMLQQLRVDLGQRVLEIGTGTGYNAALLSRLVGREGHVVTLDFDEDLCRSARDHLAAAGIPEVEVHNADGAGGLPASAPYDRLIVTACADDLSLAWLDQLVEGGRLVIPLSLAGPIQFSVAFVRRGSTLVSESLSFCGFMPLRGEMARSARGQGQGQGELAPAWLANPEVGRSCGFELAGGDARTGFEAWLAMTDPGYLRLSRNPEDPAVFGLWDETSGAALLEWEGSRLELRTYGDGEDAAWRLIAAHRRWLRERPSVQAFRVTAMPSADTPADSAPGVRLIRRPRFTFLVSQL
jgi:protein-L-isoaspartate(D-aspartate) O-methyltransferase